RYGVPQFLEQPFEVAIMLSRQNFGWREDGNLIPVFERDDSGLRSDDGLATTYVALQEPVHGMWPLHVVRYLLHHSPLRPCGFERQHLLDLLARAICDDERDAASGFRFALLQRKPALQPEELVED